MMRPSLFIPALTATQINHTYAFQQTQNAFKIYTRTDHRAFSPTILNIGYGLTDDGDFAILGVNMQDPDEDDDATAPPTSGQSLDGTFLTGTIFDGANGSANTDSDTVVTETLEQGAERTNVSGKKSPNQPTFTTDKETQAEISEYLMEIMPTISKHDIETYSIQLGNIGFHPKCRTMCELTLDDLDFMKVLHARYFFKEVSGLDHPWEV
jgi:hypothetical protein